MDRSLCQYRQVTKNVDREMPQRVPPLHGLVLAGGRGTRLGREKGALDYHGEPQARWAHALLESVCGRAFASVRADQAGVEPYAGLPLIVDTQAGAGPAAGLLAAFAAEPEAAWLLLAADLPLVDRPTLERLVAARDVAAVATGYRHRDGTAEPLCAIYEPGARAALAAQRPGRLSLRRVLEAGPSRLLDPLDGARLTSVNTAADDAAVRARLARWRAAL
jgi:molybdopterin-guanine dinucleotide biosynthesis protein A